MGALKSKTTDKKKTCKGGKRELEKKNMTIQNEKLECSLGFPQTTFSDETISVCLSFTYI